MLVLLVAACVALASAVPSPMNAGGVPYKISNGNGDVFRADFSQDEFTEFFEVYSEVQTKYSQVYWTRNPPVDLPEDIVKRFNNSVMAITGYEVDQVVKTPQGDKSVPIYNQYNHHYFGWLVGADGVVVDLDQPKLLPNPTWTEVRSKPDTAHSYPTNIVFKENPGGEFRKSYHGYPKGYAQLLHSPRQFIAEPMQIDTHNRNFELTDPVGYKPWFVPQSVVNKTNPLSGLSPLIECPCTDRIEKELIKSPVIVAGASTCQQPVTSEQDCHDAVADAASVVVSSTTVSNASLPSGCLMVPTGKQGQYRAVFNTAKSTQKCNVGATPAQAASLQGEAQSLVNVSLSHDGTTATVTLSGPSDVWYAAGFDAKVMADAPYAIVVDGHGAVTERVLANHDPGSLLPPSVNVVSNTVQAGVRTVVLTRKVAIPKSSFPTTPGKLNLIVAYGSGPDLAYHKARTGTSLTLVPSKVESCVCQPHVDSYINYMNQSTAMFSVDCEPEPRGDMLQQNNPACKMQTYHGGLRCCHHTWFLTDKEQESQIPNDHVDTYYLKFRFYFQPYEPATQTKPASHQHLHHYVFLIDAQVNDYEEVKCSGGVCQGTITAHVTAAQIGLEDIPANYTGITPIVMTPHCHAPSCLREELYNADTGALICGVTAEYGTGNEVFNERDYIALPPCLWGNEPGLYPPNTLTPDTKLRAIKYFNNSYRHLGQMAQVTGLMTYEIPN